MRKHCVICGVAFEANGRALTCSQEHKNLWNWQRKREYHAQNREQERQRKREYHAQNREQVLQHNREWRAQNREQERQRHREHYAQNREQVLQHMRERNRETAVLQRKREYRARNRERALQQMRERHQKNREMDLQQLRERYARNPEKAILRGSEYRERRRRIEHDVYLAFEQTFGTSPEIEAMEPRRRRRATFVFCKSIGLLPSNLTTRSKRK
jgi:predicted nucleic acid-binding Zn ribbon protein